MFSCRVFIITVSHDIGKYLTEAYDGASCSQEVKVNNWSLYGRISEVVSVVKDTQWLAIIMFQFR